jgi:hypothetical protein
VNVALRVAHIADDLNWLVGIFLGVEFAIDGGEGAEELIGDVREDGGAAWGNFVFSEEEKKASEEIVDGDGRAEFLEIGDEDGGGCSGLLLILRELAMSETVGGVKCGGIEATTLAIGETMVAAGRLIDKAGVSDLLGHFFFPLRMDGGVHPRGNADDCENKGVAGKAIRKTMKTKGGQNGRVRR